MLSHLPELAIVISVASFLLSLAALIFNRNTKLVELRANLLAKVLELSDRCARIRDLQKEVERIGRSIGIESVFPGNTRTVENLQKQIDEMYNGFSKVPRRRQLSVYANSFHNFESFCNQAAAIESDLVKFRDKHRAAGSVGAP